MAQQLSLTALFNDICQRLLTFDKIDQRRNLLGEIRRAGLLPGQKALDFGCGTALFARVFQRSGLEYWGYDIDPRLLDYAARLYPQAHFTVDPDELGRQAPYDFIVANCCFHHVDDQLLERELERIGDWLAPQGTFLILDLFEEGQQKSALRRLFLQLERGAHFRQPGHYRELVERHFRVESMAVQPLPLFPWSQGPNPVASNLLVLRCQRP